jgi:RNA polymerase sigma factor (sigma-70 family)
VKEMMEMANEYISGLKKGEAAAYETLVRQFETPLYRYFFASHGDPQLAGEQSVDCFSDLVESLPKMKGGPAQLRPFVFAVARNVLRRQWRRQTHELASLRLEVDAIDNSPSPDEQFVAAEEKIELIEAIRSLDQSTSDVILLRFVEQLSIAEIAEAVGEPIGTVKSRLYRGRRRLQEILQSTSGLQ